MDRKEKLEVSLLTRVDYFDNVSERKHIAHTII